MARYEIQTSREGSGRDADCLRRAAARCAIREGGVVRTVDVGLAHGCLRVGMDLSGSEPHCLREAEVVFRQLWYDAFGDQTARHLAQLA